MNLEAVCMYLYVGGIRYLTLLVMVMMMVVVMTMMVMMEKKFDNG